MDADFDKDGWATAKAIIISKAMRKITQMIARQKVALVFNDYVTLAVVPIQQVPKSTPVSVLIKIQFLL